MNLTIYFWVSVLVLAALLYFPTSKLIWVVSVRRVQRKLNRELDQTELHGQYQRARFITILVVLVFAFLFNFSLLSPASHG